MKSAYSASDQSLSWFLYHEVTRSICTPSVHLVVTPGNKFAITHLYMWVSAVTMTSLCLNVFNDTSLKSVAYLVCIDSMCSFSFQIERDLQNEALKKFQVRSILSKIYVYRCHDYMQLIALSHVLPDFLMEHTKVS